MVDDRIRAGSLAELYNALEVLANAHTRSNDRSGFTVETLPQVFEHSRAQYIEAWRIVRGALGYRTEPDTESD